MKQHNEEKKGLQRQKKNNTQHLIHKKRRRLHQAPLPLKNQSKTDRDRAKGARQERDRAEGASPERYRAEGTRPERDCAPDASPERDRARTERDCVEGAQKEKDHVKGARKRDGARDGNSNARYGENCTGAGTVVQERGQLCREKGLRAGKGDGVETKAW